MDLNLVVLCGKVCAEPEIRRFESGSTLMSLLVTVRVDEPRRRIDVLPVSVWDPQEVMEGWIPEVGDRIWVTGSAQRKFWDGEGGRRTRLEIVACHVSREPNYAGALERAGLASTS